MVVIAIVIVHSESNVIIDIIIIFVMKNGFKMMKNQVVIILEIKTSYFVKCFHRRILIEYILKII